MLLLLYFSHNYQKMKVKFYTDMNNNNILLSVWATLLAPFVEKATFSLHRGHYIPTNPSPYKQIHTYKIIMHSENWCPSSTLPNGADYKIQLYGLMVTRKMLQITNDKRSCPEFPHFIRWWQHSCQVNNATNQTENSTRSGRPSHIILRNTGYMLQATYVQVASVLCRYVIRTNKMHAFSLNVLI